MCNRCCKWTRSALPASESPVVIEPARFRQLLESFDHQSTESPEPRFRCATTVGPPSQSRNCQNVQAGNVCRTQSNTGRTDAPTTPAPQLRAPRFALTPISLVKHPGGSGMDIPGLHPHNTDTWRANPPPSYPHVAGTSPSLVATNPDISRCRGDPHHAYSDRRRWRNANHCCLRRSDYSTQQQDSAEGGALIGHGGLLSLELPFTTGGLSLKPEYVHRWRW